MIGDSSKSPGIVANGRSNAIAGIREQVEREFTGRIEKERENGREVGSDVWVAMEREIQRRIAKLAPKNALY